MESRWEVRRLAPSTKLALANALKKLLQKKFLDDITVKELVEECEVNRQTFYYHFQDIYDLLLWVFTTEAEAVIADNKHAGTWREGFLNTFRYVKENRGMILHIFRSNGREHLDRYLYSMVQQFLADVLEENDKGLNVSDEDKAFIADFFKYAFVGIMLDWISSDMKEDPETIVDRVARLLEGEFRHALEKFSK